MDVGLAIVIFAAVIAILILRTVIHIVPQYQRLVVLALGKYQAMAGPGLVLLLPPPIQSDFAKVFRPAVFKTRVAPWQSRVNPDAPPILRAVGWPSSARSPMLAML